MLKMNVRKRIILASTALGFAISCALITELQSQPLLKSMHNTHFCKILFGGDTKEPEANCAFRSLTSPPYTCNRQPGLPFSEM